MEAKSGAKNVTNLPTEIVAELRHLVEAIHDESPVSPDALLEIEYLDPAVVTPSSAVPPTPTQDEVEAVEPAKELVSAQHTSVMRSMRTNGESRLVNEADVVLVLPNNGGDAVLQVEAPPIAPARIESPSAREQLRQPVPQRRNGEHILSREADAAIVIADLDSAAAFDPSDEVQGWFVKRADQHRTHRSHSSRLDKATRVFQSEWQFYVALMLFVAGLIFVTMAVVLGWSPGS